MQRKGSISKIIVDNQQKENIDNNIITEHVDESDIIKESINFMKHATLEQKDQIIEKIKKNF